MQAASAAYLRAKNLYTNARKKVAVISSYKSIVGINYRLQLKSKDSLHTLSQIEEASLKLMHIKKKQHSNFVHKLENNYKSNILGHIEIPNICG